MFKNGLGALALATSLTLSGCDENGGGGGDQLSKVASGVQNNTMGLLCDSPNQNLSETFNNNYGEIIRAIDQSGYLNHFNGKSIPESQLPTNISDMVMKKDEGIYAIGIQLNNPVDISDPLNNANHISFSTLTIAMAPTQCGAIIKYVDGSTSTSQDNYRIKYFDKASNGTRKTSGRFYDFTNESQLESNPESGTKYNENEDPDPNGTYVISHGQEVNFSSGDYDSAKKIVGEALKGLKKNDR